MLRRPREPRPSECCGSGCATCVWDVYYNKMEQYEEAVALRRQRREEQGIVGKDNDEEEQEEEGECEESDDTESSNSSEMDNTFLGTVVAKVEHEDGSAVAGSLKVSSSSLVSFLCSSSSSSSEANNDSNAVFDVVGVKTLASSVEGEEEEEGHEGSGNCEGGIHVVELSLRANGDGASGRLPLPGDVVEIYIPNDGSSVGQVDEASRLCKLLCLNTETDTVVISQNPFVPVDSFPAWIRALAGRGAPSGKMRIKAVDLFNYYLDIKNNSKTFLRPSFFQLLWNLYTQEQEKRRKDTFYVNTADTENKKEAGLYTDVTNIRLLRRLADSSGGHRYIRCLLDLNKGGAKGQSLHCFPTLVDILELFPFVFAHNVSKANFVNTFISRLLEISPPLKAKKFSVVNYHTCAPGDRTHTMELCIRHVKIPRHTLDSCPADPKDTYEKTALSLGNKLNAISLLNTGVALGAAAGAIGSNHFYGHVSHPLCTSSRVTPPAMLGKMLCSEASFQTSLFAQQISKILQAQSLSTASGKRGKILCVAAGTGIAPFIYLLHTLKNKIDRKDDSGILPMWVMYGARYQRELVFHDFLRNEVKMSMHCGGGGGVVGCYHYVTSREDFHNVVQHESSSNNSNAGPHIRYVTDILRFYSKEVRSMLMPTSEGGNADPLNYLLACGPPAVLKGIESVLMNDVLKETDDDDESMREYRFNLLKANGQILFDNWNNSNVNSD